MLVAASNVMVRALLAPTCAACDLPLQSPLNGAICPTCWQRVARVVPPLCRSCGDQVPQHAPGGLCGRCLDDPPAFSKARSAGVYDHSLRDMIHALKYRHRRMIAPWLSARLADECADVLHRADAVVPVPLHSWRLWQRGFNQADDLARGLGLPVWRALRKRRGGPPQASLAAAERHANARGAYALARREWFRQPRLTGAVLVLVDDVMTTGATLDACARVLRAAGAAEVRAVTVARAVTTPPPPPPLTLRLSIVRR